jgi:hypothetical protein
MSTIVGLLAWSMVWGINCFRDSGEMLVDNSTINGWFEVLCVIAACLVLFSYAWLFILYQGWRDKPYTDLQKRLLWSVFWQGSFLWMWSASVLICMIGFIYFYDWFFFRDGYLNETTLSGDRSWIALALMGFLVSSLLYVPLLVYAKQWRKLVILDLVCVAVCAIAMFVWVLLFVVSDKKNALAVLMGFLAFHCTVLDAGVWGYHWYYGYYYDKANDFIQHPYTNPSTSSNEGGFPWPIVTRADVVPNSPPRPPPQA